MNSEGYRDSTADKAVRKKYKQETRTPDKVMQVIELMKQVASIAGLEVTGRIWLRDRATGEEWR